jgi:hypothetical protein
MCIKHTVSPGHSCTEGGQCDYSDAGKAGVHLAPRCYGLNVRVSPNSSVEILTPKVMLLEGGVFGRRLGLRGVVLMSETGTLFRRDPRMLPWPFHCARAHQLCTTYRQALTRNQI